MEEGSSLWERLMHNFSEEDEDQEDVEREILSLVQEGRERGFFAGSEGELISNVFEYSEKKAEDIMTHRKYIIGIDGNETLENALQFILKQNHSRFPVYDGDIDTIVGILHIRDAMRCYFDETLRSKPIKELKDHLHSASFVPEGKRIDKLFKEMKLKKSQLVIVFDEYGQTAGIIAMEDIIEQIVGNIQDEYDKEEELIKKLADGSYLVSGVTELEDLEKLLEIEFDVEDYGTINGFIVHSLDRIPAEDEDCVVEYEGYQFRVVSVQNNMIQSVRIEKN